MTATANQNVSVDVFFDFQCPFVNAAATWLHNVEEASGQTVNVNWRFFPLEQANNKNGDEWKLWEQPDTYHSKGLPAFRAAIAARDQGDDKYRAFVWELLRLRHQDGRDIARPATLTDAATRAGLDLEAFDRVRNDRSRLSEIGDDFTDATETYGAFGTPTFVFPNGQSAYLKLKLGDVPSGDDAVAFFDRFVDITRDTPNVLEIKRPTPPQQ